MTDFDATASAPPLAAPAMPAGPAGLAQEAARKRKEAEALAGRADAGAADLAKVRGAHSEEVKATRAADEAKFQAATGDIQKTLGERPHTDVPNPDLGPPMDPKKTSDLAWSVIGLSLIGIAGSKKNYGMAAAALDGMLKGYKEGSLDNAKTQREKFEREFRTAQEKQREATSVYQDLLKSKELSLNQVAHLIQVHASANQDWEMEQSARNRDFEKMYARVDRLSQGADRLDQTVAQMKDRIQAREDKAQERKESLEEKRHPTLSQDTLDLKADQYLSGDPTVKQNIGRGIQGSANLAAMENAITKRAKERGMSGKDISAAMAEFQGIKAGERTLGTRTANIEMAATEARSLAELAVDASAKVDRTSWKTLNDIEQAVQKRTASPELRAFVASNTSLINAYARAINPQGVGTVADKEHARDMLDTAFSKGDYQATVDQLMKEIDAARKSPGQVKSSMHEGFTGKGGGGESSPEIDALVKKYGG